jgi:hypothetical protein
MSESLLSQPAAPATEAPPASAPAAAPVAAPAAQASADSSQRPEWLPEKYKSPEDLAKAYKELESKLGSREEDLRNKLMEELQAEAFKDRPPSAGEYKLPDFVVEEEAVNNGLLKWWADHAFENGYSQQEFEAGIKTYMESMPAPPDMNAERSKLGDSANQRIEAASMFATKFFPKETLPAIERLCETAEGIIALEAVMEAMKDGSFAQAANPASGVTEADLKAMMKDERYWNPTQRDPNFVKQVEAGFKRLYG